MTSSIRPTAAPRMPGVAPRMERLRFMSAPAGAEGTPGAPAAPADPAAQPAAQPAQPATPATVAAAVAQQLGQQGTPAAPAPQAAPAAQPAAPGTPAARDESASQHVLPDGTPVPKWFAEDPVAAYAELSRVRRGEATTRERGKTAAEEAQQEVLNKVLQALGQNPEAQAAPRSPEELAAEVTTVTGERDTYKTTAEQAQRDLAVWRAAASAGANPAALLDSVSFRSAVGSIDPSDAAAITAAITAAVAANPSLAAGPVPPAASGGYETGRTGGAQPSTSPLSLTEAVGNALSGNGGRR